MEIKAYLIIASYAITLLIGWHGHTWYDGYLKSKEQAEIIDTRLSTEKASNEDAAKTAKKEAENDEKARASDAEVESHIESNRAGFDCVIPAIGVRDLQQAITSHTRASKPN